MTISIGVVGAGAIGSYVGGKLMAAGVDVVLVGRRPLASATTGLSLTDMNGARARIEAAQVRHETSAAALADRQFVLCCVKSGQTSEVARELAGVLSQGSIVVSLQNGLHNADALRSILVGRTVLAAIVGFNVVALREGEYRQTTTGPLVIEASPDRRMETLARALEGSGLEVRLASDIRALQWGKLIMNLNNAVSALSGAPTRDLVFAKGYRRSVTAILTEALGVMRRAGVRPASLTGLPVGVLPFVLRLPTFLLRAVARTQLRIDPQARSSMWEDLSRNRPTEVDELNGEIVRLAQSCGIEAPLNRRIVEIVHACEKRQAGSPRLGAEELWRQVTGRS